MGPWFVNIKTFRKGPQKKKDLFSLPVLLFKGLLSKSMYKVIRFLTVGIVTLFYRVIFFLVLTVKFVKEVYVINSPVVRVFPTEVFGSDPSRERTVHTVCGEEPRGGVVIE